MRTFLIVVGGLAFLSAAVALVIGNLVVAGILAGVSAICTIITLPSKK